MPNKKVNLHLIGATGFIGSHIQSEKNEEINIIPIDRTLVDLRSDKFNSYIKKVKEGDVCLLLAAVSSPDVCEKEFETAYAINVTNTLSLVRELVRQGVRVLIASSDTIFGNHRGVATDTTKPNPIGAYGKMKADLENALLGEPLVKFFRLSYVLSRDDKFSKLIEYHAKSDKELVVFNGFERNIISIDDVVCGIFSLIINWDKYDYQFVNFVGEELLSRANIVEYQKRYVYPKLKYKLQQPPSSFWNGRAKIIKTRSDLFEEILERRRKRIEVVIKDWREL